MLKQGGKRKHQDACIPGHVFHMDLLFVSGLSNLEDMISNNAPPEKTLQKNRDGYIGFLTIIDVTTHNLWTHPVKSKDLALDFINSFLQKFGIRNLDPMIAIKTVTTTKDGYLAHLCVFNDTFWEAKYNVQSTDINYIDELIPDCVDAYIKTGEFASSHAFRRVVSNHCCDLTSTGPDTSHQNGIIERPHCTLKERIRCMLYATRLGVEFWADALIHVSWLYNQTYHSAVKKTSFEAYTGCVPVLDSLITFGSNITAKKPGERPTTFHPWSYDGIFLDIKTRCTI